MEEDVFHQGLIQWNAQKFQQEYESAIELETRLHISKCHLGKDGCVHHNLNEEIQ